MISILRSMFETARTNQKRLDGFRNGPIVNVTVTQGPIVAQHFQTVHQYRMTVHLGVFFNACEAELERAEKVAWRRCAEMIYGPLAAKLSELESHVSDGDKDACLEAIHELRHMMFRIE